MAETNPTICIGIPCYQNAPSETLEDYMRFAYHLGRRMPEFDFTLAIKPKFEQFRARNSICTAAIQTNAKYILMLDDDHVIGWRDSWGPNDQYDFLRKLVGHMEKDEKLGLVGCLYFHRGQDCLAVLMKQGTDGGYYYMRDDEITGGLQEVAVQGGGCMLIRADVLLRIQQPWFEPEFKYGTDIQICQKVREAGFRVACDTSITLGHVMTERKVITAENRLQHAMASQAGMRDQSQADPKWLTGTAYNLFYLDGMEYLGRNETEVIDMAERYNELIKTDYPGPRGDLVEYYRSRGPLQVARQMFYHGTKVGLTNDMNILSLFRGGERFYGLDYCCGSSLIGFELAMRGNQIDFVDIPGAGGYEFLKWRAKKRQIEHRCGWEVKGPYDFILFMDALEHLTDPVATIKQLVPHLKDGACIITNYFYLDDQDNPEHISMDREAVKRALIDEGCYPTNLVVWVKQDLGFMDKKAEEVSNDERNNQAASVL